MLPSEHATYRITWTITSMLLRNRKKQRPDKHVHVSNGIDGFSGHGARLSADV
jgi:hypothetical protein